MATNTYAKVKAILSEVIELAGEARSRRMEELCAGDETLRAGVTALLGFEGTQLLSEPLALGHGDVDSAATDQMSGRRVGEFLLTRKLGEGGMGIVFEARQERPHRSVAVKLLRPQLISNRAVRRFEFEVETLAQLEHPNIARVFGAGIEKIDGESIPWFAMELVRDALPIDTYCMQRELAVRARVELFLQACAALDAGHARGIVHRDVKPGNLLVDRDGHLKVIDFGVARATDVDLSRTSSRDLIEGTLAYMSPEQCSGSRADLCAQIDVHALGVVLYELLCGRRPYDVDDVSIPEVIAIVREQEPVPPSRLASALKGDLDAIVLKCLEKDPRRRYSSAGALRTDLQRFLVGEMIEARAPSRWRRAARWIAKHPWPTIGIAVAVLIVVSGAVITIDHMLFSRHAVRLGMSGDRLALFARSGAELATWNVGSPPNHTIASLVKRTIDGREDKVVLFAVESRAVGSPWSGLLACFELDQLDVPAWTSAQHPLVMPSGKPLRAGVEFTPKLTVVADIFAGNPGNEIVVVHREGGFSACAIRVYDLSGRVRYEAWIDANVQSMVWMAESRLLAFAGHPDELTWAERGIETTPDSPRYPHAVGALVPLDGRTRIDTFMTSNGTIQDPTLCWLRWVGPSIPVMQLRELSLSLSLEGGGGAREEQLVLSLRCPQDLGLGPRASIGMFITPRGELKSAFADDAYRVKAQERGLPEPGSLSLFDYAELPPVRKQ